jgi:type II secretory pathway component PulM
MSQKSRSSAISPRGQIALALGGLLALALGGYFLLVSPKRSEAKELDAQIAQVETQIAERRSASAAMQVKVALKTADLFRLAKAMPEDPNIASIILELNRVASDSGIVFESITPQARVGEAGFQVLPISLSFSGNFFTLSDFLFRLRQLVRVDDGKLNVTGRLFAVNSVSFGEDGERNFPFVKADLNVDAFIFGALPAAVSGVPPTGAETTTATGTTEQTTTQVPSDQAPPTSGGIANPATPTPSS